MSGLPGRVGWRAGLALALLGGVLAGCYDTKTVAPGFEVTPNHLGRVEAAQNALGIEGWWFSFGDQYDEPRRCTLVGMHSSYQCSQVYEPPPLPSLRFPNRGGSMCTYGLAAAVPDCCNLEQDPTQAGCTGDTLLCDGATDYENVWGAGIGLDFALTVSEDAPERLLRERAPWDADAHGVTGVAFDLTVIDGGASLLDVLRVEFPMQIEVPNELPEEAADRGTVKLELDDGRPVIVHPGEILPAGTPTEEYPSGSPFWRHKPAASQKDDWTLTPDRKLHEGHNEVLFRDVNLPPDAYYDLDWKSLLGIQFLVSTTTATSPDAYGFCISNLTFVPK